MTKDTALSILRSILTLAGTYLIGHNLFGVAVNQDNFQIAIGVVISLGSTIWGIADKSIGADQIASAVRSILLTGGGLLVAAGKLNGSTLDAITGLALAVLPILQSYLAKAKVVAVATGTAVPQMTTNASGAVVPTGKLVKPGYA